MNLEITLFFSVTMISMLVIGWRVKDMVVVNCHALMEVSTTDSGETTSTTDKVDYVLFLVALVELYNTFVRISISPAL